MEKILYIGSTRQNITTRIKFNHRGFVKALRNGWKEESLGLSFGYYEEPLVLPKEVEGYLINKHKPIYNASTPNFKVVSRVNEFGSFDLPWVVYNGSYLIDRNGSSVQKEKRILPIDVNIEWIRYLENLPDDDSDQACVKCNKLIDETATAFITDVIGFHIEYTYHIRGERDRKHPTGIRKFFCRNPHLVYPRKKGNEGYRIATYHFQVPISYISKEYLHRSVHLFCSRRPGRLIRQVSDSLPTHINNPDRYEKYIELLEMREKLMKVKGEANAKLETVLKESIKSLKEEVIL